LVATKASGQSRSDHCNANVQRKPNFTFWFCI
jgi:hypothetical protein